MALRRPGAGDDGGVPAGVAAALAGHGEGCVGIADVVAALDGTRLLVPLLEVAADQVEADGVEPCAGTDRAVAVVSMGTATGRVALAFTGMEPMLRWDGRARPLPVDARRVAHAVLAEGAGALLLDAAGPHPARLGRVALSRLARKESWPEPWADPAVRDAVARELAPAIASGQLAVRLAPGPPGSADALAVELAFPGFAPSPQADRRAVSVADRLAASAGLREVFDGVLAVRVIDRSPGS